MGSHQPCYRVGVLCEHLGDVLKEVGAEGVAIVVHVDFGGQARQEEKLDD